MTGKTNAAASSGVNLSNDTVTASVMLEGYTAHDKDNNLIEGTIPSWMGPCQTPTTDMYTVCEGCYLPYGIEIEGDSNLVPENIKSGKTIFGVTGTCGVLGQDVLSVAVINYDGGVKNLYEATSNGNGTFCTFIDNPGYGVDESGCIWFPDDITKVKFRFESLFGLEENNDSDGGWMCEIRNGGVSGTLLSTIDVCNWTNVGVIGEYYESREIEVTSDIQLFVRFYPRNAGTSGTGKLHATLSCIAV